MKVWSHRPSCSGLGEDYGVKRNMEGTVDYARYLVDVSVVLLQSIRDQTQDVNAAIHSPGNIIDDYRYFVANVFRQSKVSYSVLLSGLLYLLRLRHALGQRTTIRDDDIIYANAQKPDFAAKLFVVALLLASKFLNDRHSSNRSWARAAGFSVKEINTEELEFLRIIDHRLYIEHDVFNRWMTFLFHPQNLESYKVNLRPLRYEITCFRQSPQDKYYESSYATSTALSFPKRTAEYA